MLNSPPALVPTRLSRATGRSMYSPSNVTLHPCASIRLPDALTAACLTVSQLPQAPTRLPHGPTSSYRYTCSCTHTPSSRVSLIALLLG